MFWSLFLLFDVVEDEARAPKVSVSHHALRQGPETHWPKV